MLKYMMIGIVTIIMLAPPPKPHVGYAARYATNRLMERAAEINGVSPMQGEDICASPLHALHTHLVVRSRIPGKTDVSIRCIVGDIAHPRDREHIINRGIVIELTPRAAMQICGTVRGSPKECPVSVHLWRN